MENIDPRQPYPHVSADALVQIFEIKLKQKGKMGKMKKKHVDKYIR